MRPSRIEFTANRIILTVLTLLLITFTIMGQDDDSDDDRYGGQSVDVVFPVRLHFNLTMNVAAAEIDAASVSITGQTVTVDLSDLEGDERVDLSTFWDVPASNTPAFNTLLDYSWNVTLNDGSSLQFDDSVAYAPDNIAWAQNDDPDQRISLILPGIQGDALRDELNEVYSFLLSQGQSEPHFRLALSPGSSPIDSCIPDDSGTPIVIDPVTGDELTCNNRAEDSISQLGYEILNVSGDPIKSIVPRMVSEFFATRWDDVEIPPWFEQGLGQVFIPDSNSRDVQMLRDHLRSEQLFTLEDMNTIPDDLDTYRLWLTQSHMMVRYMVSQAGIQGVFLLGRTAGQDEETFEESYERTIGQPLAAIIPSLEIWIFRKEAEQSLTIDIYAGPTELPPDTPTPSPFPPTKGPTFTPTITLTPRPTIPSTSTRVPTDTPTPTPRG